MLYVKWTDFRGAMMSNATNFVNYRRGVMPLAILSLLMNRDMYGYELVQEIALQSDGAIVTQEGSLYPVLYKLQESGYISDEKKLVGKRMTRIYYHIEPAGKEYLQELIADYKTVTGGVMKIISSGGGYNE